MKRRLVIITMIGLLALLPATASAGRCWQGGNAKRRICMCVVNGRPETVPMAFCRR